MGKDLKNNDVNCDGKKGENLEKKAVASKCENLKKGAIINKTVSSIEDTGKVRVTRSGRVSKKFNRFL